MADKATLIIDCDAQAFELRNDSADESLAWGDNDPSRSELIGKIMLLKYENLMRRSRDELLGIYTDMLTLSNIRHVRREAMELEDIALADQ